MIFDQIDCLKLVGPFWSLASRRRCDFENAATLRFEIALPKIAVIFMSESLGTFDLSCLCCFTAKKNCDLEFAISKSSDSRIHSVIFLRVFWGTCDESCDFEFAICFENSAIATATAFFWDAKFWSSRPSARTAHFSS